MRGLRLPQHLRVLQGFVQARKKEEEMTVYEVPKDGTPMPSCSRCGAAMVAIGTCDNYIGSLSAHELSGLCKRSKLTAYRCPSCGSETGCTESAAPEKGK